MDTRTAASLQGAVVRSSALVAIASGFVGAIVIAAVRIVRDGGVDTGSVLWILGGCVWAGLFLLFELMANRRLARVASASRASDEETVVLFRAADLRTSSGDARPQPAERGWFTLGRNDFSVTDYRGPRVVTKHACRDVVAAEAEVVAGSYGVLRVDFADGTSLTAIPVGTGFRSAGLSADRVVAIATAVSGWKANR